MLMSLRVTLTREQSKIQFGTTCADLVGLKTFDQKLRLTYRLPLDKIPLLDWMTADYSHNIGYQYQANSLGISDTDGIFYGNTIRNSLDRSIRGKVDFVMLYNKLRYLRFANTPSPKRKNFARSPGMTKTSTET